jgi:hypothetical protein
MLALRFLDCGLLDFDTNYTGKELTKISRDSAVFFHPEDGDGRFFNEVSNHLPDYTVC